MTVELRGASALITGAGGGIGSATALRFAREGVRHLVLVDIDAQALQRTEELVRAARADVTGFGTDVSDPTPHDFHGHPVGGMMPPQGGVHVPQQTSQQPCSSACFERARSMVIATQD